MDREEVIKLAQEAGFDPHDMSDDFTCNLVDIERFAKLVAVAEREAIAQSLDKQADLAGDPMDREWAQEMAAAIRARSRT